jgi:hypothetical protein
MKIDSYPEWFDLDTGVGAFFGDSVDQVVGVGWCCFFDSTETNLLRRRTKQ